MQVREIVEFLKREHKEAVYFGNEIEINSFSDIEEICDHSIVWVKNQKYLTEQAASGLQSHQEVLVICGEAADCMKNYILTVNPKQVYFSILNQFFLKERPRKIAGSSVVLTDKIGSNVNIGPMCYIGEGVELADDVYIHANVTIEGTCRIGKGCEIYPGVVIGADGFGYYKEQGIPRKVPHFKGVIIGEYVEIGANTCIDRGCMKDTVIGDHVKIDNLCHIAHNVQVENGCVITAGTVIAGSARLKKGVYVAPGAIIMNQMELAEEAFVGMGAAVTRPVEKGKVVAGVPAKVLRDRVRTDF